MLAHKLRRVSSETPITLAKRNTATSSTHTINWPADVASGDLALLFDFADTNFGNPADVTPTGFTRINTSIMRSADCAFNMWYKLCTGSESGSLTCMNGNTQDYKVLLVLSGGITTATVQSLLGDGAYSLVNRTPTSGSGATPLVVCGVVVYENAEAVWTSVTAEDEQIKHTAGRVCLSYKIYNSAPANITYDPAGGSGDSGTWAFYVEVA